MNTIYLNMELLNPPVHIRPWLQVASEVPPHSIQSLQITPTTGRCVAQTSTYPEISETHTPRGRTATKN